MFNFIIGDGVLLVPQKRVVRAVHNAFNPFGWSQYRQYNKGNVFEEIINNPVSIVTEPFKALDREVIQPIYREVIQPVGHALEKIGQGIAKDPLTFIAQVAAVALAPVTGGMSLWALPVIAAASTAAKGGSFSDILTATAISAATAAVGGGFGLENSVGGLITSGMQTGGSIAANTATFSIAGTSITASTASAIAAAGQGLAMGAVAATGAAATGKDPFQAALPSLVGSALGFAGNQLAQAEFFQPITSTLNDISTNVSPIVSKAMTGVASAMITGAVTGKDMTQVAIASLANTAVSGIVSASNVVADFFRNDTGGITNMGVATQSVVADLLGSVAATVASGGKMGDAMAAQFLANSTKTLAQFLDPKFDALATNVQATYKDAESKVAAVNEAANNQQNWVTKYNKDADTLNSLANEVNGLLGKRDSTLAAYNAATTQSEVNRLRAEFNSYESQIASKTAQYNALYNTIDDTNAAYLASVKATEAAQNAYFEVSKTLGSLGTQLSSKMNEISKELTTVAAKQIDPDFNAEEYKELNNLGPGVDAATHYMSAGKDQGLFTNKESASPQRTVLIDKATDELLRVNGWGSSLNVPKEVYEAARDRVENFYGYNMSGLQNFTVSNLVQQSKMPATWFAPMWDEDSKTVTTAQVRFNDSTTGTVYSSDTVLPEGMDVATFFDIQNGNANVTRGSDGNFYWTTNTGATARIQDKDTGEIVSTNYGVYFNDSSVPAGAYDISRDEQGRVTGYRTIDGTLHVNVAGAGNDQAEYLNDFGTKFDETDAFTQMMTYSNVSDGLAANFNIKGIVDASKDIVDYIQKDATDVQKLQIATIVKSGGSVLQDVGTVLQDLSVTIGLSKTGTTGTLQNLGKQLESLASASTPAQYQAAMKDIDAMRKAASGADIIGVNKAIAEKYPDLVGISVFGGELFEELIQNGVGKAAMVAGGALAATLGAPALIAGAIGAGVGYGAAMAMDFSESYRGSKEDMYKRMYDAYKGQGYSDAQANQMADAAATKAGVMNGIITMVVNGATPGDLNKVLFGGKANPAQEAVTNYFVEKLTTAAKVAASEFGQGLVEGTLQGMYNETLVYSVDPSKADYAKGMADAAMLESIIGAPVAAGTYAVDNSFDMTAKTLTLANEKFTSAIESGNIHTIGELGSVFKSWGIPASVSMEIIPDVIKNTPSILNAYSSPAELSTALKNSFGFDANQAADIVNIKFNDKVTTLQEAKDALFAAGLTQVSDKDVANMGVVGVTPADMAAKVTTYANQNMVTQAELEAAAKQENYKATADELKALVGRGVQADVIANFIKTVDPKAVTTDEATQFFKDLGYTKATATDIAQFVKSAPEAEVTKAVAAWVDPRQVTRAEAVKFYQNLNYKPTEDEINQYIVQGPDVVQEKIQKQLEAYVDPRYTTAAEVKAAALREGYTITDEEAAKFIGQYMQTPQEAAVQKFSDPLAVLADEAKSYFAQEGYIPTVEELKNYTGVKNEADTAKLIYAYADPLAMTEAEARGYMTKAGYTSPTPAEVAQFVKQAKESDLQSALLSYVDTHQVTQAEVDSFYKTLGYVPTKEEVAQFITQGVDIQQKAIENKLSEYVDPRYATNDEIRQAYLDLGFGEPTQADLDRFSGQRNEAAAIKSAEEYLPMATYHATKEQIAAVQKSLGDRIAEYEAAGKSRDEALQLAINGVAADLGTTKDALLTAIGQTEANLKTDIAGVKTELSQDIQDVAELLGKPAQSVTQADLDYVKNIIGKTDVTADLTYDVNRDGVIDIKDQTALENQMKVQEGQNIETTTDPNTGIVTTIDKTTGQAIDAWDPQTGTKWASSGIYSVLDQQKAQAAATAKAQAAQAKTAQNKSQFGQLMSLLFQAPDAAGQQVTVKTPDPAKINYIYDWSSVFATPSQAQMMPSPYGALNVTQPQQKQASNQPLFQLASGFAEGGIVGDINVGEGGSVEDLMNILKGNSG